MEMKIKHVEISIYDIHMKMYGNVYLLKNENIRNFSNRSSYVSSM